MSCRPKAPNAAWTTSRGSSTEASATSQTPPGKPRASSAAARNASLVLPAPPLPVRVSSRVRVSRRLTSLSSFRRPTKLVRSAGRLFGLRCTDGVAISAAAYILASGGLAAYRSSDRGVLTMATTAPVVRLTKAAASGAVRVQGVARQ
jgi:hypothetical protein